MIISIIAVLLLAGGVSSSLPVQGSISMIHDNKMFIDLRASKSNVSDDLDELVKKFLRKMEKPRVQLIINLGRKIIQINGETDEQDYFKIRNDIENILQRMALLMQERGNYYKKLTHQNSVDYDNLRLTSLDHQDSTNLDKNYFVFSQMLSNPEFALEIERLISRNELSRAYIKSVLLWLIQLFDVKWQLYDDLISKWKLLTSQKQVEFILRNLVRNLIDNQQQHGKPEEIKYNLEDRNDIILNTEKIEIQEPTLTEPEQNRRKLNGSNKTEIVKNNKNKFWGNASSNYITSIKETRMNHPELLKRIKTDVTDKTPTAKKIKIPINKKFNTSVDDYSISNGTLFSKIKTLGNRNFTKNEISSKSKKFRTSLGNHMKDRGKQFNQLENASPILPSENAIDINQQETNQSKSIRMNATRGFLQNVTNTLKTRRTLNTLPSNKKNVSTKKGADEYNYSNKRMEMKSDNASAMDKILEAVAEVLPTDKPVEVLQKSSESISRIS